MITTIHEDSCIIYERTSRGKTFTRAYPAAAPCPHDSQVCAIVLAHTQILLRNEPMSEGRAATIQAATFVLQYPYSSEPGLAGWLDSGGAPHVLEDDEFRPSLYWMTHPNRISRSAYPDLARSAHDVDELDRLWPDGINMDTVSGSNIPLTSMVQYPIEYRDCGGFGLASHSPSVTAQHFSQACQAVNAERIAWKTSLEAGARPDAILQAAKTFAQSMLESGIAIDRWDEMVTSFLRQARSRI